MKYLQNPPYLAVLLVWINDGKQNLFLQVITSVLRLSILTQFAGF